MDCEGTGTHEHQSVQAATWRTCRKGLYPDQTGSHCTWTATATLSGHTLTREIAGGSFVTAQSLPYHVAWTDEILFALSDLTTEEKKNPVQPVMSVETLDTPP
ncbi:hypothetical protein TNCV_3083691 [Trichonephila clavipes]|nr:hypothetical protein TNCV_3083691 [Trichonephila clavipes]